MKTSGADMPQV